MRPYALLAAPLLALAIGCTGYTPPNVPGPGGGSPSPTTSTPDNGGATRSKVLDRYGDEGPQEAVAPNDGSDGTAGSGCRPGSRDRLPDGVWMTYVTAFSADTVAVDLLCFETVESSGEAIEDWGFTNDSTRSRTVPLADDALFFLQTVPPPHFPGEATELRVFEDPLAAGAFTAKAGDATPMAWVLVEGGQVVEVYSPPLSAA
jgi:hypothetical protein